MNIENILRTENLVASFGDTQIVNGVCLKFPVNQATAIIGPSGCGKSTYLRCLNRLHEEIPGATMSGSIFLKEKNILDSSVNPVQVRRQIGMVMQKPNPFPSLSVLDNVVVGLKLAGFKDKKKLREIAEQSLRASALWDETKDKLNSPGISLSGGQQQRLCIARALAIQPRVLLMDEPTSALDPISTAKIEELIFELKKSITIVIVTHNMQQAARISDQTAFFLSGDLIESGSTSQIFTNPKHEKTESYITGRFG